MIRRTPRPSTLPSRPFRALAIGPIASVLIEDEVQDLGYDVSRFPSYLVTELVDRLAAEIRREEKKAIFIKNMVNLIRVKGYVKA